MKESNWTRNNFTPGELLDSIPRLKELGFSASFLGLCVSIGLLRPGPKTEKGRPTIQLDSVVDLLNLLQNNMERRKVIMENVAEMLRQASNN